MMQGKFEQWFFAWQRVDLFAWLQELAVECEKGSGSGARAGPRCSRSFVTSMESKLKT